MTTFIGKFLNPGEVESLLQTERDERRKRRLNQVRQQAREKASKIVVSVKRERNRQLENLSNQLKAEWLRSKNVQIEELGQLYGENLASVGSAHSDVFKDIIAKENHIKKSEEDNLKKAARGEAALKDVRIKQCKEVANVIKQDALRKAVKSSENERAQQIAALPPPPPLLTPPITQKDKAESTNGDKRLQEYSEKSTTQRTPQQSNDLDLVKVIKIPATNELDAHLAAKLDEEKQAEIAQKKMQEKIQQTKKEQDRFFKAKSRLELQQDYNRIMNKLEDLAKQEEECSETHLLFGMEKENSVLKQEQEAIVEELFSRLGLSLATSAIATDANITSHVIGTTDFESTTHESTSDDTPVVHVIVHESTSSASSAADYSPSVQTKESSSLQSGLAISNDIYANSYPLESTTGNSESSSKTSAWSEMTPRNASSKTIPTSGSSATTNDETILAGHFHDHASDSSANIPVLPSLDSSDSQISTETSQTLLSGHQPSTLEKKLIDMDFIESLKKSQHDSFEHRAQETSLDAGVKTNQNSDSDKGSATRDKQQVMQTLSSSDRMDSTENVKSLQNGKLNIMDDRLKRLALTNLIASKKLGTSKSGTKSQDLWSPNEFCNVEIKQANSNAKQDLANQSDIDSSTKASTTVLDRNNYVSSSHLLSRSDLITQVNKNFPSSTSSTPGLSTFRFTKPSISYHQTDSSSLRWNASGLGSTPDTFSPPQFIFRPNQGQVHLFKTEPLRDLSTIVEMDTPGSSQHTCWQNSSTFSLSKELESGGRFDPDFELNEPGITDEPDLTLVGSECSTCSPNRSHIFEAAGITPSLDSFISILDSKNVTEDQNDQEIKRHQRSTILSYAKRVKGDKIAGSTRLSTFEGRPLSSQQGLAHLLRELSSSASPSLDSYSTSVDSSGKKDWSTPTLSSSDSHSCFSTKLQKLPALSTPNLDFLSGSSQPSFFTLSSNPSEIKSEAPSNGEELVLSGSPLPYFTSALDLTMDNCTESLLSFLVHEKNADLAHLSTLDTICTDVDTLSGESPLNSQTSHRRDASLLLHHRLSSSQSGSTSDSMFSFLRHELSANDSNLSGLDESSSLLYHSSQPSVDGIKE